MEQSNGTTRSGITLARNPLGIISLFVFFIEAIATVSLKIAVDTEYVGHVRKGSRRDETYSKILSNLAYSLIGKSRYQEALDCLSEVKQIRGGTEFRAWHSLAMAYSYFKLGESSLYRKWLDETKKRPEYRRLNVRFFKSLYPEISHDL